jgi:hypothetical protein
VNGATGMSDMAGKAAGAAVESCGKQPRYNPHARAGPIRVQREFGPLETLIDSFVILPFHF